MKYFFLALVALLPLTACQRSEPKPPAVAALERPVVALAIKPGERVLIPRAAYVERAGVPGVFVLVDDQTATAPSLARGPRLDPVGVARFRMLRPGKSVGERLEVLAGLRGDERLVLGDLREVRDGSPIRTR